MTETLERGTLIGVVCGVVGAAVAVVAIVVVVCLCKHGQLRRSRRAKQKSRSSSPEELQDTTLSSLVRADGNGVQRRDCEYAALYPSLSRQRSPSGDDSQVTTTTPLAPATPKAASLSHQEVTVVAVGAPAAVANPYVMETPARMHSRDTVFPADNASQASMNYTAVQTSDPSLVACVAGPYAPYNAAVAPADPTDVYYTESFGGYPGAVCYEQPNYAWYVGAPVAWPNNAVGAGRPWGIVPLMSADLYLMRDTSGELFVSGLNDSAVTHVDTTSLEPERASTVDYQRDLDTATSGFSSLPRRTSAAVGVPRGVSPTHSHARNFARSASHSLHSMTRSHTPSILEEPEPTDTDVPVDVEGECIYVNVHVHRTGNALLSPSTSQSSKALGADLVRTESTDGELQHENDSVRNNSHAPVHAEQQALHYEISAHEFDENSSLLRVGNDRRRSRTASAESDKLDEERTTKLRKACEMLI